MKRVIPDLIIMSTIYSLLVLFLCLSLHACSAHSLEVLAKRGFGRKVHFQAKVAEKLKIKMDSTQKGAQNEDINSGTDHGGAIMPKELKVLHKEMKYYTKEVNSEMEHAGSEIVKSSPRVALLMETKMKGSRWQPRSVLEFGSHEKDEAMYSTNKSVHEDQVDTDYEPPQKKPPIHNKKT